jgi:hypothetical protein
MSSEGGSEQRGLELAHRLRIVRLETGKWRVPSEGGGKPFLVAVHGSRITRVQICWLSSNPFPAWKGRITAPISRFGVAKISAKTTGAGTVGVGGPGAAIERVVEVAGDVAGAGAVLALDEVAGGVVGGRWSSCSGRRWRWGDSPLGIRGQHCTP